MLRVFGNMQLAQVAGNADEIEGLRVQAKRQGSDLLIEDGNFLYARAIFMGYDLPNGNGDAIPSLYAGTFGPSFIGKHVDVNHQLDPDSMIGTIMATWHVQKPLLAGTGPKVIGRNAFGRDIDGRPRVFGYAPAVDADPMELQLEGIFRLDRNRRAGDIMARKLLAKEIDSVSQEASTAYCLCPVCAHKIAMPFDMACEHLTHGSLMLKAYKVDGYEQEVLAYKIHHDPSGTGLGCVGVPAYDKAKLAELTAALKNGHLTVEAFQKLLSEQELVWGRTSLVVQAGHDLKLIAADMAKKVTTTPLTPGTPGTAKTELTEKTPLTSLESALNNLMPAAADTKDQLGIKLASLAAAQVRLNRETLSLTRHTHMAAAWPGAEKEKSLDKLADRVSIVAELQFKIDAIRKALFVAGGVQTPVGAPEGLAPGMAASGAIRSFGQALRLAVPRLAIVSLKIKIDGFMPAIQTFQSALTQMGINGSEEATDLLVKAEKNHMDFTKRFDAWKESGFVADTDVLKGQLAKDVVVAFTAFKASHDKFVAAQNVFLKDQIAEPAASFDAALGLAGMAGSPRRLRMRAGTQDLVAAFRSGISDERSRAVVGAFASSTGEWTYGIENLAQSWSAGKFVAKDSIEATKIVNGLAQIITVMGRSRFEGDMTAFATEKLEAARKQMNQMVAAERMDAGRRVLARTWLKAFALNPSFDVERSSPAVLAESKTGFSAELATEIGREVQGAGGPWPWTVQKHQTWSEFLASKTDEELVAVGNEWKDRLKANKDEVAQQAISNNVAKLAATIIDRTNARGVVAKFFRKPVLADSHWTLFNAEGKAVGRIELGVAAGGRLDRKAKVGDREVFLGSWLQSEQYGQDLVTNAQRLGLEATLRFFDRDKGLKAGGGAGIKLSGFDIADGGAGVVQPNGSILWSKLPTLEKFNAEGYDDGMTGVRGSLLELANVQPKARPESELKSGDKVSLYKMDFEYVWMQGWIRSAPKMGEVIQVVSGQSRIGGNDELVFLVEGPEGAHDAYADVGDVSFKVTSDFEAFYADVFDYLPEEGEDANDHYGDAKSNWSASLIKRKLPSQGV